MSIFLKKANLPNGKVSSLICGKLNKNLIDYFRNKDIEVIFTDENKCIDKAVSNHADLSVLYLGDGRITVDKGQIKLISELIAQGFTVVESEQETGGAYPNDCILNHTLLSDYIIGNSKIFDESVKNEIKEFKLIHTNQGYCKCSVLVVDEHSVITDDESIAKSVLKNGLDCLLVSKGDVFLDGHAYGFIGGASGKISRNEIIFFGDITRHRDYNRINKFLSERGIKIISFNFPLTDFGGIIPIKENIF